MKIDEKRVLASALELNPVWAQNSASGNTYWHGVVTFRNDLGRCVEQRVLLSLHAQYKASQLCKNYSALKECCNSAPSRFSPDFWNFCSFASASKPASQSSLWLPFFEWLKLAIAEACLESCAHQSNVMLLDFGVRRLSSCRDLCLVHDVSSETLTVWRTVVRFPAVAVLCCWCVDFFLRTNVQVLLLDDRFNIWHRWNLVSF